MMNRTRVGAAALVIGLGADAAETHSTHEHGHAVLKLVREGTAVVVHFESPLDSIVGFEHAPANDEQRAALRAALQLVAVSKNVVRLPAGCKSTGESEVDIPQVADDHEDGRHATDEHSGAPRRESAREDGDARDPGEDGVHADLEATFHYRCESGPEWLEATAFTTFDALEEIELQAVGAGAVVEVLTAASPRAMLTGF